jgi:hypothetical protein
MCISNNLKLHCSRQGISSLEAYKGSLWAQTYNHVKHGVPTLMIKFLHKGFSGQL